MTEQQVVLALEGSKRWLALMNRHTRGKHARLMVLGRCCEWEPSHAFPCKDMVCVGLGWLMKHYPKELTKELLCLG